MSDLSNVMLLGGIDFDTVVRQYLDLDYVISLLERKKYYVKFKSEFEDIFESRFPLKYMLPIHEANKEVAKDELKREFQQLDNKRDEFYESTEWGASCWTMSGEENVLMWKSYSGKIGACIKTTVGKFLKSIQSDDFGIVCGQIDYSGYSFYHENIYFNKLRPYADERELRFYFLPKKDMPTGPKHFDIDVNVREMISEIILSPYMDRSCSRVMREMLENRYGIKVSVSKIEMNKL